MRLTLDAKDFEESCASVKWTNWLWLGGSTLNRIYRLLIPLCISAWCHSAAAAGQRADEPPPVQMKEFERWVNNLASEAGGNRPLLARKLQVIGFSCAPSHARQLRCVRFGCEKLSGLLWRGGLLQWSVDERQGKFHGSAISYSWGKGCYPPDRIELEQKRFIRQ